MSQTLLGKRKPSSEGQIGTLDLVVLEQLQSLERRAGKSILPGMFEALDRHVPANCIRMRRALEQKDWRTLRRISHNLKSSTRSLGLARLSAACAELERHTFSGSTAGLEHLVGTIEAEYERATPALERFLGR